MYKNCNILSIGKFIANFETGHKLHFSNNFTETFIKLNHRQNNSIKFIIRSFLLVNKSRFFNYFAFIVK